MHKKDRLAHDTELVDSHDLDAPPPNAAAADEVDEDEEYLNYSSCFCLPATSQPRKGAIAIMQSNVFDRFINIAIVVNCVFLAIDDPLDPDNLTARNQIVGLSEYVFNGIFFIEAVIKIVAMGFAFHPGAYLRDRWNWLDFVCVCAGVADILAKAGLLSGLNANLSVLRTFRVLKPLRTINTMPGMKRLVNTLIGAIPSLVDVLILMIFIFLLFGILGVQLYRGALNGRCVFPTGADSDDTRPCRNANVSSIPDTARSCVPPTGEGGDLPWTNPTAVPGTVCWEHHRPWLVDGSIMSFDNIGLAFLTIFTSITLEGWVDVMYALQEAYSDWVWVYMVLLVMTGSIFLLNLLMAVVYDAWNDASPDEEDEFDDGEEDEDDDGKKIWKPASVHAPVRAASLVSIRIRHLSESLRYGKDESGKDAPNLKAGEAVQALYDQITSLNEWVSARMPDGSGAPSSGKPSGAAAAAAASQGYGPSGGDKGAAAGKQAGRKCCEVEEDANINEMNLLLTGDLENWNNDYPLPRLARFAKGSLVQNFVRLAIFANSCFMMVEHYDQPEELTAVLETGNYIFTSIFALEMFLKLISFGPRKYWSDGWNAFDGVIVFFSLLELAATLAPGDGGGGVAGVSALRAFRLLRLFKLAQSWQTMQHILSTLTVTVLGMGNFVALLTLFMFIFTLLGMQLYGGKLSENGDLSCSYRQEGPLDDSVPRNNFDTFVIAFLTVFQILTGENWNEVLFSGIISCGFGHSSYFITLFVAGNFLMLNLFLAILLGAFGPEGDADTAAVREKLLRLLTDTKGMIYSATLQEGYERDADKYEHYEDFKKEFSVLTQDESLVGLNKFQLQEVKGLLHHCEVKGHALLDFMEQQCALPPTDTEQYKVNKAVAILQTEQGEPMPPPKLLFFQVWAQDLSNNKWFDRIVLTLIVVSCIALAIENPRDSELQSTIRMPMFFMNIVLTVFFVCEMIIKMVGWGVAYQVPYHIVPEPKPVSPPGQEPDSADGDEEEDQVGPQQQPAYFRDNWNILDFIIVCISIAALMPGGDKISAMRALRAFRGLRPLRLINRNRGMKVIVNSLIASLPAIVNVMIVAGMFWVIFGIWGVQLFKGCFRQCEMVTAAGETIVMSDVANKSMCSTHLYADLEAAGATLTWAKIRQVGDFDNIYYAVLTLFEVASLEMWPSVMFQGIDCVGVDQAPQRDNSPIMGFYFVLFIIVGSFLMLNMFVGVVCDSFNEADSKERGVALLNDDQKRWVDTMRLLNRIKPAPPHHCPEDRCRASIFKLVLSKPFENLVLTLILLNTLTMATAHYNEDDTYTEIMQTTNLFFTISFIIEAILKIIAFGFIGYLKDPWNKLDFFIVLASIVDVLFDYVFKGGGNDIVGIITMLRAFRVTRLFKAAKSLKGLYQIFQTLVSSLPSLGNLTGLLLLFFIIYAVLGVNVFSRCIPGLDEGCSYETECVSKHANFDTFAMALLTLFRCATGESWNCLMHDYSITTPYQEWKDDNDTKAVIGEWVPIVYFVSFTLIVAFVFLNMFVAVILLNFEAIQEGEMAVTTDALNEFTDAWAAYDQYNSQRISPINMRALLCVRLKEGHPFRVKARDDGSLPDQAGFNLYMSKLRMPCKNGVVKFNDALYILAKHATQEHSTAQGNEWDGSMPAKYAKKVTDPVKAPPEPNFQEMQDKRDQCQRNIEKTNKQLQDMSVDDAEYKNKQQELAKLKKELLSINKQVVPSTYDEFMAVKLQRNFRRSLRNSGKEIDTGGGRSSRISKTNNDFGHTITQARLQRQKTQERSSARGSGSSRPNSP